MKRIIILVAFFLLSNNLFSQCKEELFPFNIEKAVYYLASEQLQGREPSTHGDTLMVEYVKNVFESYKIKPLFETYFQEVPFKEMASMFKKSKQESPNLSLSRNVIGVIEGTDKKLKNEYIVIGAHIDHLGFGGMMSSSRKRDEHKIHYGADDNASGVSLMLDLARKFSSNPSKRSIIFIAFTCEEKGLIGSKYFVNNLPFPSSQIVGMFNFDMVGMLKDNNLKVGGSKTSKQSEKIIKKYSDKYNLNIKLSPGGIAPSDHASFYSKDIPVFYFTTGADSNYHTPNDIPQRLNYKGIEILSSYAYDLANDVANRNKRLKFRQVKEPKTNKSMSKLNVTLGIMPDVSEGSDNGLIVNAVSSGKPAEKAGIQNGDIIIELANKKVKDIYSYMEILSTLKPDTVIKAKVKRQDKIIELKIKL